ncbi:hypothetical protein N7527_007394 [Penicillium freii]|nr:hypothetical protein N7527_007394 [Penicillium freii]
MDPQAGETDDDDNRVLMRPTPHASLRSAPFEVASHSPDAADQSTAPVLERRRLSVTVSLTSYRLG